MVTESNVVELPQQLRWYSLSKLKRLGVVIFKDYPILWLTLLFVVLVFPALTAQ